MQKVKGIVKDCLITVLILCCAFLLCMVIQRFYEDSTVIPAIFVLAVFIISVLTSGYFYGIASALISMFAVNFAFTFPYFAFNFTIVENFISAVIFTVVAIITSMLTVKIKTQEAQKAAAERESMRANLLRAISHDLRTPLTTIYGASSAILDNYSAFSEEQNKEMLNGIKEDSQWLIRMVENLLSITRLDGGNVKIIKTDTVLDELVDSVLLKFSKRYPDVKVVVNIPEDFTVIPMDAILIEQVAINILENAVQHAYGMTEINFRVSVVGSEAIFEIKDDGCGIDGDRIDEIFTGYFRKDDVPSDSKKNNAGIGLSVCSTIINAHGGKISCGNLKGGGAVFRFTLNMEGANEQ